MINTPQYSLAQYLDGIIKPCIPSLYMLSSTKAFVDKIANLDLNNSCELVSYDVENLLTNVPLTEIIDIACQYVYREDSTTKPTFDQVHFKKTFANGYQWCFHL